MAHLAKLAGPGEEPARARPIVLVTVDHQTLTGQLVGTGHLHAGPLAEPISLATVRQLACDAGVLPAVLDGPSARLDLGRLRRTASTVQRLALVRRDGPGCAFPRCDRPFAWTDAHHIRHWADGGATDVSNLVLLCGAHHDLVHHHGWSVAVADGRPQFHPPDAPLPPDDG
jgi:hypothetical protein